MEILVVTLDASFSSDEKDEKTFPNHSKWIEKIKLINRL